MLAANPPTVIWMNHYYLMFAIFLLVCGCTGETSSSQAVCTAPTAEVGIDHVVVAVSDLESSTAFLDQIGFTTKSGRLHENGIINSHVKLLSDQSLEMMALSRSPNDTMSQEYADIILAGGGGAFLALGASQQRAFSIGLKSSLSPDSSHHAPFRYVTFGHAALANVFVIQYDEPYVEVEQYLNHENGAAGISQVWIEAGSELESYLLALGGATCGEVEGPSGFAGLEVAVRNGSVVIVPAPRNRRARVIGTRIITRESNESLYMMESANSFWISLEGVSPNVNSSR